VIGTERKTVREGLIETFQALLAAHCLRTQAERLAALSFSSPFQEIELG